MQYGFGEIITLLGALGLFLYGMKVMSDALMEVAGDKMRNILASMTSNRVFAVFTGFFITAIIQSSSATTLMVVSFVNASLLTLTESVGVIMGSNIGTTVTAWLITILGFKVSMSVIALPLVGLGFLLTFSKKLTIRHWGSFIIGFAILFIGLQFLKDSVPNIQDNPGVLEWLKKYTDLGYISILIFLAIGTILTVIVQSSSATMALTLVMCYEGWIPFDMAAAMVLGENIGTTITANLAAIVANYHAKRTARAHFIFNMLGVIWMLILFYPFLSMIEWIVTQNGSQSPFIEATSIPVALSVYHTLFNIINTLLMIFFIPLIVKIVTRLIPEQIVAELAVDQAKFLNEDALNYPQTAIQAILNETKRLLEGPAFKIIAHAVNIHRDDIKAGVKPKKLIRNSTNIIDIDINEEYYRRVKSIYSKIIEFSTQIQAQFALSTKKTTVVNNIKTSNRHIVQAIRDASSLQNNVDKFMFTDNEQMRKEYDKLRKQVTRVLKAIYNLSTNGDPNQHLAKLEELKVRANEDDLLLDGTLDRLIRKELITSDMATSLANDSNHVTHICKHLINAAELLYIQSDTILVGLSAKKNGKKKAS
ncbi:MAG: Na/Pi cotransporter family protein [Saprospiraceae bacterium]|nr:Na/Pi cotransporter family protein [Saprospiraceae bacterium]